MKHRVIKGYILEPSDKCSAYVADLKPARGTVGAHQCRKPAVVAITSFPAEDYLCDDCYRSFLSLGKIEN